MPDIPVPSPSSLARIRQLLARPDQAARGPAGVAPHRPTEVVRCGTLISASPVPHYDGMIRAVPGLGSHSDAGTEPVVLASLSGDDLTPGDDYLAARAGSEDGVPVYWTRPAGGGVTAYPGGTFSIGITADTTWTGSGAGVSNGAADLTAAGVYLIVVRATAEGSVNTGSGGLIRVRLYDDTAAAAVADTAATVLHFSQNSFTFQQTVGLTYRFAIATARTVRVQAWRSVGVWTQSLLSSAADAPSHLSWVKVA